MFSVQQITHEIVQINFHWNIPHKLLHIGSFVGSLVFVCFVGSFVFVCSVGSSVFVCFVGCLVGFSVVVVFFVGSNVVVCLVGFVVCMVSSPQI